MQSILDQRRDQIFPKLDPLDIERVRRFGDVRSFAAGERLMTAGQISPGLVVILAGRVVAVTAQDPLGIGRQIVTHAQGNFMGELAELAGRPALVDARGGTHRAAGAPAGIDDCRKLNLASASCAP